MIEMPRRGLFFTGTDTEVGKTYVTALVARELVAAGRRVGVYKPVASGCRDVGGRLVADDAEQLREAIGSGTASTDICPQVFRQPLAPPLAARAEGKSVDAELLRRGIANWKDCDIVLVEGVGGLLSPLSDEDFVADLACDFGYPLVVVAPNVLGVINQTLQTLVTASTYRDGLEIAGVVLNDVAPPDPAGDPSIALNRTELEKYCMPPVLAHVGWQAGGFASEVDWFGLAEK